MAEDPCKPGDEDGPVLETDDAEALLARSPILDDAAVAAVLRVPVKTVRGLHQRGALRGHMIGRWLRWRAVDVRRFIDGLGHDGG